MKILTIIGARPQFIKLAPVSREIRKEHQEVLVHTGQHYDDYMSKIFFEELNIPKPDYNLGIGSASHGKQTGEMLIEIEKVILHEKPNYVIVYGDTNSTIAGALASSKLHVPLIHVEAGLRSYNKKMPEEQNRILTDHISDILLCPTQTAVKNLRQEGIIEGVYNIGDIMYDSVLYNYKIAEKKSNILNKLYLENDGYYLATVHRAENTDKKNKLLTILEAFNELDKPVIFPIHPRTNSKLEQYGKETNIYQNVRFIQPVSYLDMINLIAGCKKVLTDSGGLQKEAYFLDTPCITLRNQTEWVETLKNNWNILVKIKKEEILEKVSAQNTENIDKDNNYFGDGKAAKKLLNIISNYSNEI
ncbi:MAG: non-hydrolyzing UDP-N-acetylglucosamine 2-epimerase [bacterium]